MSWDFGLEQAYKYNIEGRLQTALAYLLRDTFTNKVKVVVFPHDFTTTPNFIEHPFFLIKTAFANNQRFVGNTVLPQTRLLILVEITPIAENYYTANALRAQAWAAIDKWRPMLGLLVGGRLQAVAQLAAPMPAAAKNIDKPLWAYPIRYQFEAFTYPGGKHMSWIERYFVTNKKLEGDDGLFTITDRFIQSTLQVFRDGLLVPPEQIEVIETDPSFVFRIIDEKPNAVYVSYIKDL